MTEKSSIPAAVGRERWNLEFIEHIANPRNVQRPGPENTPEARLSIIQSACRMWLDGDTGD